MRAHNRSHARPGSCRTTRPPRLDDQRLVLESTRSGSKSCSRAAATHPSRPACSASRHLVFEARDDESAGCALRGAVHRDQVAVEDADVAHAHAAHLEQVVRSWLEEVRVRSGNAPRCSPREDRAAPRRGRSAAGPSARAANRATGCRARRRAATRARPCAAGPASASSAALADLKPSAPGNLGACRRHAVLASASWMKRRPGAGVG